MPFQGCLDLARSDVPQSHRGAIPGDQSLTIGGKGHRERRPRESLQASLYLTRLRIHQLDSVGAS